LRRALDRKGSKRSAGTSQSIFSPGPITMSIDSTRILGKCWEDAFKIGEREPDGDE
jgi:hypothetical protein